MATAAKKTAAAKTHHAAEADEVIEHTPTPDEARAMFEENPGLSNVLTTEGNLSRDGILTAVLTGA